MGQGDGTWLVDVVAVLASVLRLNNSVSRKSVI